MLKEYIFYFFSAMHYIWKYLFILTLVTLSMTTIWILYDYKEIASIIKPRSEQNKEENQFPPDNNGNSIENESIILSRLRKSIPSNYKTFNLTENSSPLISPRKIEEKPIISPTGIYMSMIYLLL